LGLPAIRITPSREATKPIVIFSLQITNNWGSGTVTQFNYGYNALQQRTFSMQSGSAYADYYSGTSYSSVFNFHTYDSYGQLSLGQCIAIRPVHPSLLLVRAICYRLEVFQFAYDAIGNRQEVGEKCLGTPPNRFDTYASTPPGLNEYSSRDQTIRFASLVMSMSGPL